MEHLACTAGFAQLQMAFELRSRLPWPWNWCGFGVARTIDWFLRLRHHHRRHRRPTHHHHHPPYPHRNLQESKDLLQQGVSTTGAEADSLLLNRFHNDFVAGASAFATDEPLRDGLRIVEDPPVAANCSIAGLFNG